MPMIIDPRAGDAEDDISAPKARSMIAIAGSLLAEISPVKFFLAWVTIVVIPGILLGIAPLVLTAWLQGISNKLAAIAGIGPVLILVMLGLLAWFGFRPLFLAAESSFWSMNSVAVQPGYALCREVLRHIGGRLLPGRVSAERRSKLSAATAVGAGLLACGLGLLIVSLAWPHTRWNGAVADLAQPLRLIGPALANTIVLLSGYFAAASLAWGLADATMGQPTDLETFAEPTPGARRWRVVHLSDIHLVGEKYGFRIESGRAGPRGNGRFEALLTRLDAIHAEEPIDHLVITGDMTDAGRSSEWIEFLAALSRHPTLRERTLILPGNHDVNIVDKANPARLDLPWSPGKRLRQMRTLSAMAAVHGDRCRVIDPRTGRLGPTLSAALERHRDTIAAFADAGGLKPTLQLGAVWNDAFPAVVEPDGPDGLGMILLNSNAETHFSFTNALGLVPAIHVHAVLDVMRAHPSARWVIALHHHLVEYPKPAKALSERIGTALINGSWVVRQLEPFGDRLIVMHGHRHIDWIGTCGPLRIISAPSPVMEGTNTRPTYFHIHTLEAAGEGKLALIAPQRIDLPGDPPDAPLFDLDARESGAA